MKGTSSPAPEKCRHLVLEFALGFPESCSWWPGLDYVHAQMEFPLLTKHSLFLAKAVNQGPLYRFPSLRLLSFASPNGTAGKNCPYKIQQTKVQPHVVLSSSSSPPSLSKAKVHGSSGNIRNPWMCKNKRCARRDHLAARKETEQQG